MNSEASSIPPPEPPYSSGMVTPSHPSSAIFRYRPSEWYSV